MICLCVQLNDEWAGTFRTLRADFIFAAIRNIFFIGSNTDRSIGAEHRLEAYTTLRFRRTNPDRAVAKP
jgi:hypothetical protein